MTAKAMNSDKLFNEEARKADLDTPLDRFYDLMLAAFRTNVHEAFQNHKDYPHREPDAGLVQNAAAWAQECALPDMAQSDIARCISHWIVREVRTTCSAQRIDTATQRAMKTTHLPMF